MPGLDGAFLDLLARDRGHGRGDGALSVAGARPGEQDGDERETQRRAGEATKTRHTFLTDRLAAGRASTPENMAYHDMSSIDRVEPSFSALTLEPSSCRQHSRGYAPTRPPGG